MLSRRVLLVLLTALTVGPRPVAAAREPAPDAGTTAAVEAAIVAAVRARLGASGDVRVADLRTWCGTSVPTVLSAVPEPGARLGGPVHFRIVGAAARGDRPRAVCRAVAVPRGSVTHVRARRLLDRGHELSEADIETTSGEVTGLPLRRLPLLGDVVGARVLVTLAPGEVIAHSSVASRPAVKSGDAVHAVVRVGDLEVAATLAAVQDGVEGAVIRVVNRDSRRELRARVRERGVVDVVSGVRESAK